MRSFLALLMTFTILLVPSAQAQDDTKVFTSDSGMVSFEYPADWFAVEDEAGDFIISNDEITDEQMASGVFTPGADIDQVFLVISVYDPAQRDPGDFIIPPGPPIYLLGYYSGLFSFIFASNFDTAIDLGEPQEEIVNDTTFAIGELQYTGQDGPSTILIITSQLVGDIHLTTSLAGAVESLDSYLETALEIVSTVTYETEEG